MKSTPAERLRKIRDRIHRLEVQHDNLATVLLPSGCDAKYWHGTNLIRVTVVRHVYDKVVVRGIGGTEYTVGIERLL
jgi:hypothetical protein